MKNVTEENKNFNGLTVDGKIYIGADAFEKGGWGKVLVHEYTHLEEGTAEYEAMVRALESDEYTVEVEGNEKFSYEEDADFENESLDSSAEIRYNRKRKTHYNQYDTLAMQWAFSSKTKPGDVKVLYNAMDNTWNKLVAEDSEERYGVLLSIEDTPQNAQAIIDLYNEVYNENNGEQQGTRESLHTSIERYGTSSRNIGNDMLDVEEQGADGRVSGIHRGESERYGKRTSQKGDRNSQVSKGKKRVTLAEAAIDSVMKKSYNISKAEIEKILEKKKIGLELSREEKSKLRLYESEKTAHSTEILLGNEKFIERIMQSDAGLAKKLFVKITNLAKSLGNSDSKATREELKRLKHAQELYLKAAEKVGNAEFKRIMQLLDDEEEAEGEIPEIKYSNKDNFIKDKYYDRQVEKWESLKSGGYINVGEISVQSPINKVGLPEGSLYFDVSKLQQAMSEHSDHLSVDRLKEIPIVLNNPIAITKYSDNTVNVFGEILVNNSPLMIGIVISKDNKGRNSINKIRTVHARRDAAKFINDKNILYLNEDKKRTRAWFQALGNSVPLGGTRFGFIRSIADYDELVNTNEKKSPVKYSLKESEDSESLFDDNNLVIRTRGQHAAFMAEYHGEKVFTKKLVSDELLKIEEIKNLPAKVREKLINDVWEGYNNRLHADGYELYTEIMWEKIPELIDSHNEVKMVEEELEFLNSRLVEALSRIVDGARPAKWATTVGEAQKLGEKLGEAKDKRFMQINKSGTVTQGLNLEKINT